MCKICDEKSAQFTEALQAQDEAESIALKHFQKEFDQLMTNVTNSELIQTKNKFMVLLKFVTDLSKGLAQKDEISTSLKKVFKIALLDKEIQSHFKNGMDSEQIFNIVDRRVITL